MRTNKNKSMSAILLLLVLLLSATISEAFRFNAPKQVFTKKDSRLYENFNFDFKNPEIFSDPKIFSERQLWEFRESYSVDERKSILDYILGFFKKNDDSGKSKASGPSYASALKPTVSVAVLEEKTADYVRGKIDAKAFYTVLNNAFGNNLNSVLPDIIKTLPKDKAFALSKITK